MTVGLDVNQYADADVTDPAPFKLVNVSLDITPGSFVAIVGKVCAHQASRLLASSDYY